MSLSRKMEKKQDSLGKMWCFLLVEGFVHDIFYLQGIVIIWIGFMPKCHSIFEIYPTTRIPRRLILLHCSSLLCAVTEKYRLFSFVFWWSRLLHSSQQHNRQLKISYLLFFIPLFFHKFVKAQVFLSCTLL